MIYYYYHYYYYLDDDDDHNNDVRIQVYYDNQKDIIVAKTM